MTYKRVKYIESQENYYIALQFLYPLVLLNHYRTMNFLYNLTKGLYKTFNQIHF